MKIISFQKITTEKYHIQQKLTLVCFILLFLFEEKYNEQYTE
jgi:hypothetical protein